MQLLQDSQGCTALLDAAPDGDPLGCWLPELDAMTTPDNVSSSLSDWVVGLSPRLHQNAAAAHHQASTKEGTLGVPPSALQVDHILAGLNCQVPLDSPLGSSSAGNSSNSGSCSTQGVHGLSPSAPQQRHLPTFQQQHLQQKQQQQPAQQLPPPQQACMDYCCPVPYNHMCGSSNSVQHGPPGHSGCWPGGVSAVAADSYTAAGPSFMGPGAAAAAGSYQTTGPYGPSATYPGPPTYQGFSLPAAVPPLGPFHQGFPVPALEPAAATAMFYGMPVAAYSSWQDTVGYPTHGPFTEGTGPVGYDQGFFPMQPPMQAALAGSCAGPCCTYPPAACMDGQYYCPAPMQAQAGFVSGPLAGQHSSSGLAGHYSSSRSSLHAPSGPAELAGTPAAAAGAGGYPASYPAAAGAAWEDVAASPAASAGKSTPSAAAAAANGMLNHAVQHTCSPRKQQQQQQQVKLSAPAAAAGTAAKKAAKYVAVTPRVNPAAAAVRKVQSGAVSKPALRGAAAAAKPLVSKAVKRKMLEEQQQCVMLDSAQKVGLVAGTDRTTVTAESLQAAT